MQGRTRAVARVVRDVTKEEAEDRFVGLRVVARGLVRRRRLARGRIGGVPRRP